MLKTFCAPACGAPAALPLAVPPCFACPPTSLAFGEANAAPQHEEEPKEEHRSQRHRERREHKE